MNKVIQYIKGRNIYNISALEREAGMPSRTLHNVMQGKRELPEGWVYPLMLALGEVEIDGWKITADPDLLGYFGRRFDESRPIKEKEVKTSSGSYVQYYVPEIRRYWGEVDFLKFIEE